MGNNLKIVFLIILSFGFFNSFAQNDTKQQKTVLFTDRDYCISGDTVWFKVWMPKSLENLGNIVHVQLDSKSSNLISAVTVKSKNDWAQGFINIPDSLSTGQYFVTSFVNAQRNAADLETESKSLFVYNRFEENVAEMEIIQPNSFHKSSNKNAVMDLSTDREQYLTREKVEVKIGINTNIQITNAIVKATLVDPLAGEIEGDYIFKVQSSNSDIPDFVENDGFLLNGKVTDIKGNVRSDALVVLSISGVQPYFDYCYLGKNGDFHFFIKDAFGKANVVLQVVSNRTEEYYIQLENNKLTRKDTIQRENKILNPEQTAFITTAINGSFVHKLFNPSISVQPVKFEISTRFSMPFYGQPSERIIPAEFIDLPDFQEISREILPGFQYRNKDGEITFRMININQKLIFEDEPLRLLNGIPVFKNNLFASLKSTDISYIDLVKSERIFGDLILKGVLAVSLTDKSNSWMAQQPNIFQFNINFLQPDNKPDYSFKNELNTNQPDMRQVFVWEIMETDSIENIVFYLSDRKGIVKISVEGITSKNEFFKTSKMIEVK